MGQILPIKINILRKAITKYLFYIFIVIITINLLQKNILQENLVLSREKDNRIPSIVHFVIGQGDRKNIQHQFQLSSSFTFINYLNMLAARRQIRPKKLYVHYYEEPNTFWWNQTKQDPDIDITLVKSRLIESIFNKSVDHHAHRGDIMRLEILLTYGGIYLDIDVLALRSFEPLLNISDVVMAHQDDDPKTACNAVIIGKKNASFLRRLYDSYQSFDANCWDCHSVRYTGELALIYSNEVLVLPTINFFRPSWSEPHLLFHSNNYNFRSNYASHLWNKLQHDELNKLTVNRILNGNFTLARMFLHAIGKDKLQKLKTLTNQSFSIT
jgi:hypothetical protein